MRTKVFGRMPEGDDVLEVVIGDGGFAATIITYGAVIRDVRLAGVAHPLVLGLESLDAYIAHSPHLGAIAGRYANRIARGRFKIDAHELCEKQCLPKTVKPLTESIGGSQSKAES